MILIDIQNRCVEEALLQLFSIAKNKEKKLEKIDVRFCDFDGVVFHISNPQTAENSESGSVDKTKILVSVLIKCYSELEPHGVRQVLESYYGTYLLNEPETGYNVSLLFDLTQIPDDYISLAKKASFLRAKCFASVMEKYFNAHHKMAAESAAQKKNPQTAPPPSAPPAPAVIHYRSDEVLYIAAQYDRVTVVFGTVFSDADDIVISKVFLQEFKEAKRKLPQAPQVLYSSREPPTELHNIPGIKLNISEKSELSYITFILFPHHMKPGSASENSANLVLTLRNYIHYHIKCSKAYIHQRMRTKTNQFLKILNRARPEPKTRERKTISGRYFSAGGAAPVGPPAVGPKPMIPRKPAGASFFQGSQQ